MVTLYCANLLYLVLKLVNIMRETSWLNLFINTDNFVSDSMNVQLFLTI